MGTNFCPVEVSSVYRDWRDSTPCHGTHEDHFIGIFDHVDNYLNNTLKNNPNEYLKQYWPQSPEVGRYVRYIKSTTGQNIGPAYKVSITRQMVSLEGAQKVIWVVWFWDWDGQKWDQMHWQRDLNYFPAAYGFQTCVTTYGRRAA